MSAFLEYDPVTGMEKFVDADDNNRLQIHYRQDVEPILDYAKEIRNSGAADKGIKNSFWHYAIIPPVVEMELLVKYGLRLHNKNHQKRIFELINSEYPYCKTTDKRHYLNQ